MIPDWLKAIPAQNFASNGSVELAVSGGPHTEDFQANCQQAHFSVYQKQAGSAGDINLNRLLGELLLFGVISEPRGRYLERYTVIGMAAKRLHMIATGDLLILPDYDPESGIGDLQLLSSNGAAWLWSQFAASVANLNPLSPRERQVLTLLSQGCKYAEIGRRMGISDLTIKVHMRRIRKKVGPGNRRAIVAIAKENGWIP